MTEISHSEWTRDMLALIDMAERGWNGEACWHVFEWMGWMAKLKYPLVREVDQVINFNGVVT